MNQRVKTLRISAELFFELFGAGLHPACAYEVLEDAIPKDARLINVRLGWPYSQIEMLIESAEFPELKEGDEIPYLTPVCRTKTNASTN